MPFFRRNLSTIRDTTGTMILFHEANTPGLENAQRESNIAWMVTSSIPEVGKTKSEVNGSASVYSIVCNCASRTNSQSSLEVPWMNSAPSSAQLSKWGDLLGKDFFQRANPLIALLNYFQACTKHYIMLVEVFRVGPHLRLCIALPKYLRELSLLRDSR